MTIRLRFLSLMVKLRGNMEGHQPQFTGQGYRLRTPPDNGRWIENEQTGTVAKTKKKKMPRQQNLLLCRQCLFTIANPSDRIIINGSHNHTFANPHGIVFEIGCFADATGCGTIGAPTNEFTWFNGYFWQVAICGSCLTHIGWRFSGSGLNNFFGLIHDRLVESASA